MLQLKSPSVQTNILLTLLVILMALVVILQYLSLKNFPDLSTRQPTNQVETPPPVLTVAPEDKKITWNQRGIPIVRGEFAHYASDDDCVALVIDQPVTTNKSLDNYIKDYTSAWTKITYPRYKVQYKVGNYSAVTLEAMNMEELSNTFVKNGDSVYKITAMMISNSGPPSCLLDYNSAISDLLSGLRFNQPTTGTQELGYIKKAHVKNNQQYIDIDYVEWINDPSAPNGFRISNQNTLMRTLKVSSVAKVYLLDWTDKGMIVPQINFDEFIRVVKGTSANYNLGPNQLFDIELDKNSLVTKISLRYTP